ncbi:MAG TPA: tetratricopeptide repeat protein [Chloroflexota bacterium]|nr:tetratricopeptide repeat protein [Chloroflexota bacterium]
MSLPSGTVTFLFTDIEGSTRGWDQFGAAMDAVLARHDTLLTEIVDRHGGTVFKTAGDAVCAVFERPLDAAMAAIDIQRALQHDSWEDVGGLRVRIGLHTGSAFARDQDYLGPVVNRVTRIVSAAHGQQTLVSAATADLIIDELPPLGFELRDLGEHRLKDLSRSEHIYQLAEPALRVDFPPLRSLDWHPNNLPTQLTTLVGREREMATARELLLERGVRLLTLTGPGGVGKTHLALQIAADLLHDFADGAFWVPLAAVSDASLVLPAIANVLGVREMQGVSLFDSVVSMLSDKHMLLVLDNSEQVLPAATELAALLGACGRLQVLVTSRALLRLYGEHDLPVEPLTVPGPSRRPAPSLQELMSFDAITLFTERARAVRPEFNLTEANADAVAELCRRLDGLPLAIELAAAQVRLLTPQATLARIDAGHGSPGQLRVIGQGPRDLPIRHQSLVANIAWSYDLLDDAERVLFRRLAVFVDSSGFDSIERVCADEGLDALDTLASLVDKSLVRVDETPTEPRYRMLETIRSFAHDKLEESGEVNRIRDAHRDYFLEIGEYAEQHWWGPEQVELLERLHREQDNVRAALRWCLEQGEIETGLRLASSIWRFWEARGRLREGRESLERLLALVDGRVSDTVRARALSGLGILAFRQGDYDAAREAQEESLVLRRQLGTASGIAMSLSHLGDVARQLGELDQARAYYEESLDLRRSIGYRTGVAISLTKLALIVRLDGDLERAQALFEESLTLHRAVGNRSWEAAVLNYLGRIAFYKHDPQHARELHVKSLEIRQETGERWETTMALCHLGDAEMQLGDLVGARSALVQSLRHWHDLGDTWGIAYALEGLGYLAHRQSDVPQAIRLFAASQLARQRLGAPPSAAGRERLQQALAACQEAIGADEYQRLWDSATTAGPKELIQEILDAIVGAPLTSPTS